MSLDILRLFEDKEIHSRYHELIQEHLLTNEVATIFRDMNEYYDSHSEIDWTDFATWFNVVKHPTLKEEKRALYNKIFDRLINEEADEEVTTELLEVFITRDTAGKIAYIAGAIAEGVDTHDLEEISSLLEEGQDTLASVDSTVDQHLTTNNIEELVEHIEGKGGYEWRLDSLNVSLGPIRQGDFVTLVKRPETGGTTLLASEATFMANQLEEGKQVLWFNNEEESKKVKFRIIQAALGMMKNDILADPLTAYKNYETILGGIDNILVFKDMHHIKDIEKRLHEYNPGLIIIDQLWNCHGFEKAAGNEVTRQGMLFRKAREWAGEHAPVLNVHQADGTAEGVQYINMSQLYGSKTAIQAHVDALICIGRSFEPGQEMSRFINIPKNKLSGGPKTDESLRHGKFEVLIKPEIARYED